MGKRFAAAIFFGFVLFLPFIAPGAGAPRVISFSPQGMAKEIQQVAVTFSEPIVPFGDPGRAVAPFRIDCKVTGSARWIDERSWVYDFPSPLPPGLRCSFELAPDLVALSGAALTGTRSFSFSSGGPAVMEANPWDGAEIVDDQIFLIRVDGEPTEASVLQSVAFSVAGSRDPIGIRVLAGSERDEVLGTLDEEERKKTWVVLQARQRFPAEAKVTLQWGPGVATQSGVATDKPQLLHYNVRPPFRASVQCGRERPKADCVPISPVRILFSSPVPWEMASRVALVLDGAGGAAPTRIAAGRPYPGDDDPLVERILFKGPFAPTARYRVEIPGDLRDDSDRTLQSNTLEVRTAGYPPLAKFPARFGILELRADPAMPVTLRALEPEVTARLLGPDAGKSLPANTLRVAEPSGTQILDWLRRLEGATDTAPLFAADAPGVRKLALPLAPTPASGDSEVIGIPLKEPGLHLVEIESKILGQRLLDPVTPMYVASGALVTDLAVHFAWGRDSSLVWVTSLEQAKPVAGAKVTVVDCHGDTRWEGTSDAMGVARIEGLPQQGSLQRCEHPEDRWSEYDDGLLVLANKDGDTGFVHSSWTEGIESWRFQVPTAWFGDTPLVAHTIFARTLLRAGETVHMKHVLRKPSMRGFALASPEETPTEIAIRHEASGQEFVLPVSFDSSGTGQTEWRIPPGSKLGTWSVTLQRKDGSNSSTLDSGSFRVEEFRLPFMRGTLRAPTEPLIAVNAVPVDFAVQYLSGGAAAGLPVEIRSELSLREILPFESTPGLERFLFGRGAVAVGVHKGGLDVSCDGEDCPEESSPETPKIATEKLTLDAAGTTRAEIPVDSSGRPKELSVELAYRDPAGAVQTASTRIPIWPASRVVGLHVEGGYQKPGGVRSVALVVDLAGKPVAGANVTVEAFEQRVYTHRRRLVGGFYAYTSVQDTRPLRRFCEGATDSLGRLECNGVFDVSGNVKLEAKTTDPEGRPAVTWDETWLEGEDPQWFEPSEGDRMDLLPERRQYEPGEKARFQVRMPFPDATALVVVERAGVGEHFVVPLSGKDPVVEVPVTGAYAPNVFVSVLAVRGRVGDVKPTAMVDLGRPAYRLGIAEIQVGWKDNRLDVHVETDREVYRVRERALVRIAVAAENGEKLPPGSEVAVAAVDEALLELLPNQSWELLPAMMGRRNFGVSLATAQGLVIGKRHFGLKALPHGGGGGRKPTRELFDTLLQWQSRVPLDAKGRAIVDIPLNDSLTSFRIAVVATGGTSLFGTGSATIRTTQDLMVLPGLPPVVREGDHFQARFTLRNTTKNALDVILAAQVKGLAAPLAPIEAKLASEEAREVGFDVTVPASIESLDWEVAVQTGGRDSDRLRVAQRVVPAVPVRVFQGTVVALEPELKLPLQRPAAAIPGRGGIDVAVKAKLADGMNGITDFLRKYPFGCLEQKTSIAIGLHDTTLWQALVADLPSYLDDDGLAKFFPSMSQGSTVLTSYLLSISNEAGFEIPKAPRDRMLDALALFAEGKLTRTSVVPAPDLPLRKLAALEALARYGRAKASMLAALPPQPALWPTSSLLDWIGVLRRTSGIPAGPERLRDARQLLRARLVLQGTTLSFTTQSSDDLTWLLATPDLNAARAILEGLAEKAPSQEMARLVRGALGRQVNARWDSTMADAWGVVALDRFSQAYESTPVSGAVEATLAGVTKRLAWDAGQAPAAHFDWPNAAAELSVRQDGPGHPWATIQSLAAIPLTNPITSGFSLEKTVTPVQQRQPGSFSRGDIVKVTLEGKAQTDTAWVVVRDPIPAGASILGSGLGGGSLVASAATAGAGDCPCPAFTERSFEAFTQFYEWVPQGAFSLEYVMVLNQDGSFGMPPTRVEAMYAPEVFAEIPNKTVVVTP